MFEYSEDKKDREDFETRYYARDNPIHKTTQEDINDLLDSSHEVDYDRLPYPDKKIIPTGVTDQ